MAGGIRKARDAKSAPALGAKVEALTRNMDLLWHALGRPIGTGKDRIKPMLDRIAVLVEAEARAKALQRNLGCHCAPDDGEPACPVHGMEAPTTVGEDGVRRFSDGTSAE